MMIHKNNKKTLIVFLFFLLFLLVVAIFVPSFRTLRNLSNILVQFIPLAIISMGQTFVLIAGGVDLSLGAVMSAVTVILATQMNSSPLGIAAGLFIVFVFGLLVGLFNGLGAAVLKLPPIIVTISSMTIVQGIAYIFLKTSGGSMPKGFVSFLTRKIGILTVSFLFMFLIFLILQGILSKTRQGLHLYAVGHNKATANSAGVKVEKTIIFAYSIGALGAVLAGIVMACRLRSGDPIIGTPYALDSITASVIGGASFAGGEGFLLGTLFGSFIIGMLSNIMNSLGVSSFYQYVLKGLLLIITMAVYTALGRMEKKKNVF
jgi:ribose/xylose/arabinose/galactoside ABC-type transport system permease subunit